MTEFELWSLRLVVIVNVVLFAGAVLQLHLLRTQVSQARESIDQATKSADADHSRRREQATIEFYATTLEKRLELIDSLPDDRDTEGVRDAMARADTDQEAVRRITNYFRVFEIVATGVNLGVLDLRVIHRLAGSSIVAMAANYKPWIDRRRELLGDNGLFIEIEQLAGILRDIDTAETSAQP